MFSGIIEEIGIIQKIQSKKNLTTISIKASKVIRGTKAGDSIAINGVCLTVVSMAKSCLSFDVMKETLDKTVLGNLNKGSKVNLERSLKVNGRLHGHFVLGHVDGVGATIKKIQLENYVEYLFSIPKGLKVFIAPKGSISINGVSLTIGNVSSKYFSVYLIPFTLKETTFGSLREGTKVNLEVDVLARYILNKGF